MHELFATDIQRIKGVGVSRARLFEKLGVTDVGALLHFYPRGYEDWSSAGTLAQTSPEEVSLVKARVTDGVSEHRIRKGMTLYKCRAVDDNGVLMRLTFFNNRYIGTLLRRDTDYVFRGKVTAEYGSPAMTSPDFRVWEPEGGLVPVYPQTEGLTSRIISRTVAAALELVRDDMEDTLPPRLTVTYRLPSLKEALRGIHFPSDSEELAAARRRLIFEELLVLQLGLLRLKSRPRSSGGAPKVADHCREYLGLLPFELTGAQRRAIGECLCDMSGGGAPMQRLLQGDVGSGKTAVAAALCFCCARSGMQAAMMAPTELLAEQHYHTLKKLLEGSGLSIALLTGSVAAARRRELLERLAAGEIDVLVGTHALISKGVEFADLALVVTDEQHRFGVGQRAALSSKGRTPHVLAMSATPIPRTLALMVFGDMDISVLDELPKGRIPVETYVIDSGKRSRAYNYIRNKVKAGEQAFVVCPLVSEGESDLASAEEFAARLSSGELADCRVGLLHGRMKPADKEYAMRRFVAGQTDVLVSTTVVEVGVDVPNATVMLIENAERYGLAQLHQLRGRVGRGSKPSCCILVSDAKGQNAISRLETMKRTTDGFEISSEDLKLRGPGDFFGSRQHGLPVLHIADLAADTRALATAQQEAREILAADPQLALPCHRGLARQVSRMMAAAEVI